VPSRYRVPAGWLLGLAVFLLAGPRPLAFLGAGLVLALIGEGVRLWASGHIDKTRALATGGPYAHTRNPLYFGSLLIGLGVVVAASSPWAVGLVSLYFAAFYPRVMREEARFLKEKFPAEYAAWAPAVPFFLPRLTPGGPRASRFEWKRVAANREWRTAAALPVVVALLCLRGLVLPH
jgi:protein-S-isoprenylcysteine O-methyltransferase Ste14